MPGTPAWAGSGRRRSTGGVSPTCCFRRRIGPAKAKQLLARTSSEGSLNADRSWHSGIFLHWINPCWCNHTTAPSPEPLASRFVFSGLGQRALDGEPRSYRSVATTATEKTTPRHSCQAQLSLSRSSERGDEDQGSSDAHSPPASPPSGLAVDCTGDNGLT